MLDELRRIALIGSGVAELTRNRAEQMVKQWVGSGDVRRDQATAMVKTLLDVSRQSRKELGRFVRTEVQAQIEALGVASKREVERLERRVARLEGQRKKTTGPKKTAGRGPKTAAQSTATRRKTAGGAAAARRKTAAAKSTRRKTPSSGES